MDSRNFAQEIFDTLASHRNVGKAGFKGDLFEFGSSTNLWYCRLTYRFLHQVRVSTPDQSSSSPPTPIFQFSQFISSIISPVTHPAYQRGGAVHLNQAF